MGPADFIAIGVIALVIGGAVFYIIKAKKSGKKCIGCPDGATCGKSSACSGGCASCGCGCGGDEAEKTESDN